jgi:hypothetical protein
MGGWNGFISDRIHAAGLAFFEHFMVISRVDQQLDSSEFWPPTGMFHVKHASCAIWISFSSAGLSSRCRAKRLESVLYPGAWQPKPGTLQTILKPE